jgi:hypothetical protein
MFIQMLNLGKPHAGNKNSIRIYKRIMYNRGEFCNGIQVKCVGSLSGLKKTGDCLRSLWKKRMQ